MPKCPNCDTPVNMQVRFCTGCGMEFSEQAQKLMNAYFELKSEQGNLDIIQNYVASRRERVNTNLTIYETRLVAELGSSVAARPAPEPSPGIPKEAAAMPQPTVKPTAAAAPAWARPSAKEPAKPKSTGELELSLGQKWLLIIGIVTMIFGIGYFLKYSFERGWIGPAGRVAMAYLWGVGLLMTGERFRGKNYQNFGLSLIGGGIATLYFAAFAAFHIYHLFGQPSSFFIMSLITILACTLAIVHNTVWLSALGLIGGFMTPFMLSTGVDNQMFLMTYMAILNIGILTVAFYKKWDLLNYLGFVFTMALYAGWYFEHYNQDKFWPSIIFLNIFYLIYCVVPIAYGMFKAESERLKGFIIITPNSFISFLYGFVMVKAKYSLEWVGIISAGYALIFLLMATFIFSRARRETPPFVILIGHAALFLAVTVPILFSEHWITAFWAVQAAVMLWMAGRLSDKLILAIAYALLAVAAAKFLAYDYSEVFDAYSSWRRDGFTFRITDRLICTFMLLISMYYMMRRLQTDLVMSFFGGNDKSVMAMAFGTLLFYSLNIETLLFFGQYLPKARFASVSILWAVFSIALMYLGFRRNNAFIRRAAIGLFFITLIKVFLSDVSFIDTPYRILSFIVLGLMLIGTSYLYHKYKDKIIDALKEQNDLAKPGGGHGA